MSKRIEWIDIFKALAIILVVVGHSTGLFNKYIYQFHMAAFFFISGYTENLNSRNIFETFINKLYRLILPLITIFTAMLLFVTCLNRIGWYNILFQDSFIGFSRSIREFFYGRIYINWLGATWFLVVLFGIIIMQKVINIIFNKVSLFYMISSTLLFLIGYFMVSNKIKINIFIVPFDLVLIGQFYFAIGNICKRHECISMLLSNKYIRTLSLFLTTFSIWYFGNVHPVTVDYPSRRFGFCIIDAISAISGIVFLCIISDGISKIRMHKIKNMLIIIGKNTLGILFFHFLNFKISYILLAIFKIVPWTYINTFVPTTEIGKSYWWMIASISIVTSILEWQLIIKSKIGYSLLGQNKTIIKEISKFLMEKLNINKTGDKKFISFNNVIFRRRINRVVKYMLDNKAIIGAISILIILIAAPMMIQGIIINDELQSRFWSMQGFKSFFIHYFNEWQKQGRLIMAVPATVSMYLSFITCNREIFRLFSIIGILLNVILFGMLLYKLFRNRLFSIFTGISFLVFLPITFEHAAPNAFVNLFSIPFSFLLISLILFINYLEKGGKGSAIISCVLLFMALSGYEMFIMFTPLYFLLILHIIPRSDISFKNLFSKLVWPAMTSSFYLIIYFLLRKLMHSSYEGNQIYFTIHGFLDIVKQLFKSSIPGYFLFNRKYEYLFNVYSSGGYKLLNMRIILILIFYAGILIDIFKSGLSIRNKNQSFWYDVVVVLSGIVFTIIPTFLNAISKMYQQNVNAENFIALPVTYFNYFFMIFTICYAIWQIIKKINRKSIYGLVIILLSVYCIPIQAMNDTFSRIQSKDYDRMITIEQFLGTNVMKNLNNNSILSSDLYIQKNALSINEGYWRDFAKIKELNLDISGKNEGQNISISYPNDKYFQISAGEFIVILSKQSLSGKELPVKIPNTKIYQEVLLKDSKKDHEFYVYTLQKKNSEILQINDENPLKDFISTAGNTLETSEKLSGYYSIDGWLEKESEFNIKSGNTGKIIIEGYYPKDITENLTGRILINGLVAKQYKITSSNFKIELKVEPNKVVNLKIENNFDFSAKYPDIRKLSFVLKNMSGI